MTKDKISLKLLYLAILTGLTTGCIVASFQKMIQLLAKTSYHLLTLSHQNLSGLFLFALFFAGLGLIATICVRREPLIGGSGIPQVNGQLRGLIQQRWSKVLIHKYIGGLATIGSGLTLGREGPSVQIGATIGQGISELFHCSADTHKFLIAGAAGAGMSAAFNAPLSGIIFVVEELFHQSSRLIFLYSAITVLVANLVAVGLLGNFPSIPVLIQYEPTLTFIVACLGLGLLTGLSGLLFNQMILKGKALYQQWTAPWWLKTLIPYLVTGILLFIDAPLFGSGGNLINLASHHNPSLSRLLFLYIIKLFLLTIAFCSGLPGGIFFPLLALGALVGNIYGSVLYQLNVIPQEAILYLSIIGMSSHFAAIVRATLTGIILILEMTGASMTWFLPITLVSYLSNLTSELLANPPIYDSLLQLLLSSKTEPL